MNVLFFAARRADLCLLRFGRRLLGPHGLTPARFDLLFLLSKSELPIQPSEIARSLGVSRPVITVMVRSLVDLGLVISHHVGQLRFVELTKAGRTRLRQAIVSVKKPNDRDVPERFGAAKKGLIHVLEEWEERFLQWQQTFGKEIWLLYRYNDEHPDN